MILIFDSFFIKYESSLHQYHINIFNSLFPYEGIQGNDIGDVKFNSDGDGLGRYSVYQYQHTKAGGWEYNWIGEFGEKDNFRWEKINKTGREKYQDTPSLSGLPNIKLFQLKRKNKERFSCFTIFHVEVTFLPQIGFIIESVNLYILLSLFWNVNKYFGGSVEVSVFVQYNISVLAQLYLHTEWVRAICRTLYYLVSNELGIWIISVENVLIRKKTLQTCLQVGCIQFSNTMIYDAIFHSPDIFIIVEPLWAFYYL